MLQIIIHYEEHSHTYVHNWGLPYNDRVTCLEMDWISFVEEHFVAIVSTHDSGKLYGVPIYYLFIEDDKAFYFITKSDTKKYINIENNKSASLTIFTENPPIVFTANCAAELLDFESDDHLKIKNKLVGIHSTREYYPSPIATLKEGALSLVKLNMESCKLQSYKADINFLNA